MQEYLNSISTVLLQVVGWMDSVVAIFTDNPVLMTFLALAVIGTIIGIVRGLVRGA